MIRRIDHGRRRFAWLRLTVVLLGAASVDARAEDRSDLPLKQALLGHWQTHSKATDYCFAENGDLTVINSDGSRQEQTYVVKEADETEEVLQIAIKEKVSGRGHEKELRFAADRLSLMSTIRREYQGKTFVVNLTWNFVDDAQTPPK